jgi:outer membrane lipoprotein-sorting protein
MNNTITRTAAILLIGAFFSGCATVSEAYKPTEAALRERTANVLGFPVDRVKISNIRSDGDSTYYLADAPTGRFTSSIPSGAWNAASTVMSFGQTMTHMKTCEKQ